MSGQETRLIRWSFTGKLRIPWKVFDPEILLTRYRYAAEEGGLLGSVDIWKQYKAEGKDAKAMLQQDMTGYSKGTTSQGKPDVVGVITDNVDAGLTEFITKVIDAVSLAFHSCCFLHTAYFERFGTSVAAELRNLTLGSTATSATCAPSAAMVAPTMRPRTATAIQAHSSSRAASKMTARTSTRAKIPWRRWTTNTCCNMRSLQWVSHTSWLLRRICKSCLLKSSKK